MRSRSCRAAGRGAGREAFDGVCAGQHADKGQRQDDEHELLAEADGEQDRPCGDKCEGQNECAERPPTSEAAKAALSARAPSPRLAMGKPSSTVAAVPAPPGTPISTELKVSAVAVTASQSNHHRQGRAGVHAEDERQDHRHAREAANTGQDADNHAEADAEQEIEEMRAGQELYQGGPSVLQNGEIHCGQFRDIEAEGSEDWLRERRPVPNRRRRYSAMVMSVALEQPVPQPGLLFFGHAEATLEHRLRRGADALRIDAEHELRLRALQESVLRASSAALL